MPGCGPRAEFLERLARWPAFLRRTRRIVAAVRCQSGMVVSLPRSPSLAARRWLCNVVTAHGHARQDGFLSATGERPTLEDTRGHLLDPRPSSAARAKTRTLRPCRGGAQRQTPPGGAPPPSPITSPNTPRGLVGLRSRTALVEPRTSLLSAGVTVWRPMFRRPRTRQGIPLPWPFEVWRPRGLRNQVV